MCVMIMNVDVSNLIQILDRKRNGSFFFREELTFTFMPKTFFFFFIEDKCNISIFFSQCTL